MCDFCRDLKPVDCPGCHDNDNDDLAEQVLAELFRTEGEPIE